METKVIVWYKPLCQFVMDDSTLSTNIDDAKVWVELLDARLWISTKGIDITQCVFLQKF